MQNRYAGDIGDYIKYALLKDLSEGLKLGVAWYLYPDEGHNDDGKHIKYLEDIKKWKHFAPDLFECLRTVVNRKQRSTNTIASSGILPKTIFANEALAFHRPSPEERKSWRVGWFNRIVSTLDKCDIVFADPDNGLCETERFSAARRKDWKRLPLTEAAILAKDRTAIFYHHNTRFKGGHDAEIKYWLARLPPKSMAIYCNAFSCRTFFIVNPTSEIANRARCFAKKWLPYISLVAVEQLDEF